MDTTTNYPDASFAAMQHRAIAYTAQIRKAGARHHECCRSMAEVVEHEHADAIEINDRICKACGGTGSVLCPECPNGCQNCGGTSIVTCDVCDAIDFDHETALKLNAEIGK